MIISRKRYNLIMSQVYQSGLTEGWVQCKKYIEKASILAIKPTGKVIEEAEEILRNERTQ